MAYKTGYENYIKQEKQSTDYPNAFNFYLINTIDELKRVLNQPSEYMGFDTETTGLNPDVDTLVGYSFCMDGKNAYYVPVDHAEYLDNLVEITEEEYNTFNKEDPIYGVELKVDENKVAHYYRGNRVRPGLGKESLDLIYNKMLNTRIVFMFNARFDMRFMEQYGFVQNNVPMAEKDLRSFYYYDMSRVSFVDVQAIIFLLDTNVPYPSLKGSEEYYLGWRGATFSETLGDAENFYHLKPEEAYQYAATDALGTLLLGIKYQGVLLEAKKSGYFDNNFLYPLMLMENEYTHIDTDLLRSYSEYYHSEMTKLEQELYSIVGRPFNISSPTQKSEVFTMMNIDTGERNKRGELKAGKALLENIYTRYPVGDPRRTLMEGMIRYGNLKKQQTSYVDNTLKMCEESLYKDHLRFSYKTTTVPTGRLAAGGDAKNKYASALNVQQVPKPHSCNYYYIRAEHCPKQILDRLNNERQEFWIGTTYVYRLLDWVFKTTPWEIEGVEEWTIEGFKQDATNIRSTYVPDDGRYWISCDFSGEELRLSTLYSKEPVWLDAFKHGKDLHYATAESIFGVGNVNKERRKLAKQTNFSVLYGATARRIQALMKGTLEEAEDFLNNYKRSLPVLFKWIEERESYGGKFDTIYSYYGRPRRIAFYFRQDQPMSIRSFGLRTCVNNIIQSTGADVLKYSFLKLYDRFFRNNRDEVRKYVKFLNTVHDEINFNVSKEKVYNLVPQIIGCMILQEPTWEFPLIVGLDIGTRWGNCIEFEYDPKTYQILEPGGKPYVKEEKKVEEVKEEPKVETPNEEALLREELEREMQQ